MQTYIGLDVSDKETSVCVMNERRKILWEGKCLTDPDAIADVVRERAPRVEAIGIETGALTPWLVRELQAKKLPAVCLDARAAKAVLDCRPVKTDKNDARTLAELMSVQFYRQVHVKSEEAHEIRSLLNSHQHLVNSRRNLMGVLRGQLKPFGLKLGKVSAGKFETRVRELVDGYPVLAAACEGLLITLKAVTEELGKIEKLLRKIARGHTVCRRLMTVPGVGVCTALSFLSLIDNPNRFKKARDVGPYIGLTPKRHQSGEVEKEGKISRWGDKMSRQFLYAAANSLLGSVSARSELKSWGLGLQKRTCKRHAKVAVARKLTTILFRIWVDGTEFEPFPSKA